MKDFRGIELAIGDEVVFCKCSSSSVSNLYQGIIIEFCNRSGYECAKILYRDEINKMSDIVLSERKICKL